MEQQDVVSIITMPCYGGIWPGLLLIGQQALSATDILSSVRPKYLQTFLALLDSSARHSETMTRITAKQTLAGLLFGSEKISSRVWKVCVQLD